MWRVQGAREGRVGARKGCCLQSRRAEMLGTGPGCPGPLCGQQGLCGSWRRSAKDRGRPGLCHWSIPSDVEAASAQDHGRGGAQPGAQPQASALQGPAPSLCPAQPSPKPSREPSPEPLPCTAQPPAQPRASALHVLRIEGCPILKPRWGHVLCRSELCTPGTHVRSPGNACRASGGEAGLVALAHPGTGARTSLS